MRGTEQIPYLPGFRHIIRDISEAGGALVQLREIVADYGIDRVVDMLNVGLHVYESGNARFVSSGDVRLMIEMLERMEDADAGEDDDEDEAEPLMAAG
jgi:hypothetical protein